MNAEEAYKISKLKINEIIDDDETYQEALDKLRVLIKEAANKGNFYVKLPSNKFMNRSLNATKTINAQILKSILESLGYKVIYENNNNSNIVESTTNQIYIPAYFEYIIISWEHLKLESNLQ